MAKCRDGFYPLHRVIAIVALFISGLLCFSISCIPVAVTATNPVDYPLALKTRWTYHIHQELGAGVRFQGALAKIAKGNVLDATIISEVTGTDLISGTSYVRVESRIEGNPRLTEWYRLGSDGLLLGKTVDHDTGDETIMDPPQRVLSKRMKTGESWSWTASKAPVRIQTKIVGPARVNVPAGDFEATLVLDDVTVEMESNRINGQQSRWFVPGTGYVKQETKSVLGKLTLSHMVLTLEKFEPGKGSN